MLKFLLLYESIRNPTLGNPHQDVRKSTPRCSGNPHQDVQEIHTKMFRKSTPRCSGNPHQDVQEIHMQLSIWQQLLLLPGSKHLLIFFPLLSSIKHHCSKSSYESTCDNTYDSYEPPIDSPKVSKFITNTVRGHDCHC